MLKRHRSKIEIVTEVVGAATLGAVAVLALRSLPSLKRYLHLKLL